MRRIEQIAKIHGVSVRSIERATFVINNGIPEVEQAVRDGLLKLGRAVEIARLPANLQAAALAAPCRPAAKRTRVQRMLDLWLDLTADERDQFRQLADK